MQHAVTYILKYASVIDLSQDAHLA